MAVERGAMNRNAYLRHEKQRQEAIYLALQRMLDGDRVVLWTWRRMLEMTYPVWKRQS